MEFKYTSSIIIDDNDMNRICNEVKSGEDFSDAFDDVMSEYDDCDYYHIDDIYDSVKEEIERRIKESEKEETPMPMVTKDMTDEELIALRKLINETLAERDKAKLNKAIENFRKAFEEVKEMVDYVRVGDEMDDNCHYIEEFEQFHFDIY